MATPATDPTRVPRVSPLLWRWFTWYARRYLSRHFHAVRVSRATPAPDAPPDTPLLIYLNHPSWWDPLTCLLLAHLLWPDRRHFAPIDGTMLARYRFFQRLGFFGVQPGTVRGGATFLRTGLAVCQSPGATLWVTAEGRFTDPRVRPVRLRAGLAHLLGRLPRARAVPLALEYVFWDDRFPEILVRFGPPVTPPPACESVGGLTAVLERRLEETQDALAAEAGSRDPARFDVLLPGASGVGGVYGLWRRFNGLGGPFTEARGEVRSWD